MRGRLAQVREEWAQSRWASHGVDERDGRVSVASVGEKDARKRASEVGHEGGRVAIRIDSVECLAERREGIELRKRVGERAKVAAASLEWNHRHASDRL